MEMVRSIPNPFISHFFGCSSVSADNYLIKWAAALLCTPTCELSTTLWNTVFETNIGLLCKNYWCISERRICLFGLCQTRGLDTPSALLPRDRRHSWNQRLHLRYEKEVPEHRACSDGILALKRHMMAKEIGKHVQTLMTALRGNGHHI